jgi:hypothetical protein
VDLRRIEWASVDWIHAAQNRDLSLFFMNTSIKHEVPKRQVVMKTASRSPFINCSGFKAKVSTVHVLEQSNNCSCIQSHLRSNSHSVRQKIIPPLWKNRFVTVFTRLQRWSLFFIRQIRTALICIVALISILILYSLLHFKFPN